MAATPDRDSRGVAVVTGGSAGVGRATVREFARQGYDVAVLARGAAGVQGAVDEVEQLGVRALGLTVDVSDAAAVAEAGERIESELGPIEVWVNNAFVGALRYSWDQPLDDVRRITDVTYYGQVYGTQVALRHMRGRDRGSIVNVSSSLAHRGIPLQSAYCGAKHAVKGYTESLRVELAATGSRVAVSLVTLPGVNTPQFDWNDNDFADEGRPMPVPPIYQPEVAARTIVDVAQRPRHDAWVGAPTVATILGNRLAPSVVDWQLARSGKSSQLTEGTSSDAANLYEARDQDADHGSRGAFTDIARDIDPVSWLGARVGRAAGQTLRLGLTLIDRVAR